MIVIFELYKIKLIEIRKIIFYFSIMIVTTQNNKKFENGLNIHLLAFSLPKELINDKDEVRISITTIPDENKQNFSIEGKKMYNSNHVFWLNITNKTKKIIMVFRKKIFLSENPIIASTIIHFNDFKEFPNKQITSGMISTEFKNINIYYPLQKQIHEEGKKNFQRKILGKMQIQLTFTVPYSQLKPKDIKYYNNSNHKAFFMKENKIPKLQKNMKKGCEYEYLIDDCSICDSYLI